MRSGRWRRAWSLAAAALGVTANLAVLPAPAHAATSANADPACTGYVGLTFDDGPNPDTTVALLDALQAAGLRATMFNTGQNVQAYPDLARAQVAAGMWIGNHSWDHPYLTRLSTAEQISQISRTQEIIEEVTGVTPTLFRPPYLDTDDALRAVERRFGLTEINADVDSQDWNNASVDQIVDAVRRLQAGDVILMHDWPANTIQAIPRIAAELRGRGLCAGMISPVTGRAVAPDDDAAPSPSPSASPGPSRSPSPSPRSGACTATYRTINSWPGGFQGEVVVANPGGAPLNGWRVTMTLPAGATITNLWNGVADGTSGTVTVRNAPYNGTVDAGWSTLFGFIGTGDGTGTTVSCATGSAPSASPSPSPSPSASPSPSVSPSPSASPSPSPSASPSPSPSVSPAPGTGVLAQVHTVGRVRDLGDAVQYTWPGISFEGRFRGTGVGIVFNDPHNDYDIQIDGVTRTTLRTPGRTTHWVTGLSDGEHTVRVVKRTESPWGIGEFGGLVAAPGGGILAKPAARSRQIEFIGDSWTAGYGNMSTSRDCSGTGGVNPNSNADLTFAALTARELDADHQINAWSGRGMVRNYNGSDAGTDYRTYYDRVLQAADGATWQRPSSWKPQVVVIGLGINDFSTALNPGERWTSEAALAADFRTAYHGFLDKLRSRYGPDTYLVLTYPTLHNTTALADSIRQIVQQRNSQGDTRVKALHYDNQALGLDLLGCDWHPSQRDHEILADALTSFLRTLPLDW